MCKFITSVVTLALLATLTGAQSFNITGMWGMAPVTLNGQAGPGGGGVRVAPAVLSSKGSLYYNSMVDVGNGFDMTFTFKITVPAGNSGADGVAFVLHGDPRGTSFLGNHAAALGYGAFATSAAGTGLFNALAIEIDTFSGSFNGYADSGANEISVHTNGRNEVSHGEDQSIGRINVSTAVANFSNGLSHTVRVLYVPGTLDIFINGAATPILSIPYSIASGGTHILTNNPVGGLGLSNGKAWIGFTSSCGGSFEDHDILAWSFASATPAPAWPGNAGDLDCEVKVNDMIEAAPNRVMTALSGDIVSLRYHTGALVGQPFSAFYQLFLTGSTLSSAVIPGETPPGGFWLDVAGTNLGALTALVPFIDGMGLGGPVFLAPVLLPEGYVHSFVLPPILAGQGTSLFLQGLAVEAGLNGLNLAIDDAIEIQVL